MSRITKGLLLAPLAAPVIGLLCYVIGGAFYCLAIEECFPGPEARGAVLGKLTNYTVMACLYSYGFSIFIGYPVYQLCNRMHWLELRHCIYVSAIVGGISLLVMLRIMFPAIQLTDYRELFAAVQPLGLKKQAGILLPFLFILITSLSFWFIALRPQKKDPRAPH